MSLSQMGFTNITTYTQRKRTEIPPQKQPYILCTENYSNCFIADTLEPRESEISDNLNSLLKIKCR